ncbi:MAG TPA: ROK family protein [Rhodanobacteraceae bacterium]|nr:ROK family protein [Rhodanobacteraceae bacterium]
MARHAKTTADGTRRDARASARRRRELADALAEWVPFPCHGTRSLDAIAVTSYNIELRDGKSFVGDRASKSAFLERLEEQRAAARERGADPFGKVATAELSKKAIERTLRRGRPEAAALVHAAIDAHAQELVGVIERFRRVPAWRGVERVVIGGGFSEGRVGALVIARAQGCLDERGAAIALHPIRRDPDEAGLAGAPHLVPPWVLEGFGAMLAVDLGGSNVRCGIVAFRARRRRVDNVRVVAMRHWQHAEDDASRTALVDEIVAMLGRLAKLARKERRRLAPLLGIGCPGLVAFDGHIERGAQNLPGEWHRRRFHLPSIVRDGLGEIAGRRAAVIMHNDAVVQGLGECSRMRDARRWGVLTIGTGLGNATYEWRR